MNLAEVVHAGWAHRNSSNLSLLDAAHMDTRDSVLVAVELKSFEQGYSKGGSGPSYQQRKEKTYRWEMDFAAKLGQDIAQLASESGQVVDLLFGHRPPATKAKTTKTRWGKRSNENWQPINSTSSEWEDQPTRQHYPPTNNSDGTAIIISPWHTLIAKIHCSLVKHTLPLYYTCPSLQNRGTLSMHVTHI